MQPDPALAGWLARGDAASGAERRDGCPWQEPDALILFRSSVAEAEKLGGEACDHAFEQALDVLLRQGAWLDELIEALAAEARADPFFTPPYKPLTSGRSGLVLAEAPSLTLVVTTLPAAEEDGRGEIAFAGRAVRVRVHRAGGASAEWWERSDAGEAGCGLRERRALGSGEVIGADGVRTALVLRRGGGPAVLVEAMLAPARGAVACHHAREDGQFLRSVAADEAMPRAQLLLTLLRTLARRDAAAAFEQWAEHPSFAMRWYAARERTALVPSSALPMLRALAHADPHPEVRTLAAATIAQLHAKAARARCPCPA